MTSESLVSVFEVDEKGFDFLGVQCCARCVSVEYCEYLGSELDPLFEDSRSDSLVVLTNGACALEVPRTEFVPAIRMSLSGLKG